MRITGSQLRFLGYIVLGTLSLAAVGGHAFSADLPADKCSTVDLAHSVIASHAAGRPLAAAVGQSVPTDPRRCVPSYCEASRNQSNSVKSAVGAGISDAFNQLIAADNTDLASNILDSACGTTCDSTVLNSFAASQATTPRLLCEKGYAGGARGTTSGDGTSPDSGGGGHVASSN